MWNYESLSRLTRNKKRTQTQKKKPRTEKEKGLSRLYKYAIAVASIRGYAWAMNGKRRRLAAHAMNFSC